MTKASDFPAYLPLDERFMSGTDLMGVLISCGVNCKTCYASLTSAPSIGTTCRYNNAWAGTPEMSVCLKWRLKESLQLEFNKKYEIEFTIKKRKGKTNEEA